MYSSQLSRIHRDGPGIWSFLTNPSRIGIVTDFSQILKRTQKTQISPGLLKDNPESNFIQAYLSTSLSFRMK